MAHAVTLAEFRTRVRQAADCEVGAAASRIPDTELNEYINRHVRKTYDQLVKARGEQYYGTTATVATTAGTALYTWAMLTMAGGSPLAVTGVALSDGAQGWHQLTRYESQEWARMRALEAAGGGSIISECAYNWAPLGIYVRPAPLSAAWTLYVHHVPSHTELAAPGDTFDGINGWEDTVIYGAALECARKDDDTERIGLLKAQLDEARAHIVEHASRSDQASPRHIVDTRRDWAGCGHKRMLRSNGWYP